MSHKPTLQDVTSGNPNVPTIPAIMARIDALTRSDKAGTHEIGELVAQDAPLAARVLKIANSAFYGLRGRCLSTEHASTVLGLDVLRSIVSQAVVMRHFEQLEHVKGFDASEFWKHSILTARLCSLAARKAACRTNLEPEGFYVCGLLHDIGKVVMLERLGSDYVDVIQTAKRERQPAHAVEARQLGFTHTQVGAFVATRWQLPDEVAVAIEGHHAPPAPAVRPVVTLVALADRAAHGLAEQDLDGALAVFDAAACARLGLAATDVRAVLESALAFA